MKTNQSAVYGRDALESLGGNSEPLVVPTRIRYVVVLRQRIPKVIRLFFLFFIATIPFEPIDLMSDSLSPAKISGLLFFASCFLSPKRCFAHPHRALWWLLDYIVVFAVLQGSVSSLVTRIQLIFLLWVATNLFKEEKLARSALLTFVIAVVILALCTTLHLPGFSEAMSARELRGSVRVTALGYNPNELGGVMALAIVILIGFQLEQRRRGLWRNVLFTASTLLLLGVLVGTGSRGGVGALIIGVSVYLLPLPSGRPGRRMTAIALAVCAVVAIGYMVTSDPMSSSRWEETYSKGDISGRDRIYQVSLQMLGERPILGWGPDQFTRELGSRTHALGAVRDTHNLIFHLFLEVGAMGAVPFLVGLGICTQVAWRGRMGSLGSLPLAVLIAMLAGNLVGTGLTRKLMWLVLALALAATSASYRGQGRRIVQSNL